jgi:hypothetical protein
MLDHIGDIRVHRVDSGRLKALIENATGGTDERLALKVFVVAGLLADQEDAGGTPALSKYGLRGILKESAALTGPSRFAERGHGNPRRQELKGADRKRFPSLRHEFYSSEPNSLCSFLFTPKASIPPVMEPPPLMS